MGTGNHTSVSTQALLNLAQFKKRFTAFYDAILGCKVTHTFVFKQLKRLPMSPTVQTLLIGALLALAFFALGLFTTLPRQSLFIAFAALWLGYCLWHLSVGMGHGYSFVQELPFLLINFIVPAVLAWVLLYKVKS
jgi:phosphatidylserine synthase